VNAVQLAGGHHEGIPWAYSVDLDTDERWLRMAGTAVPLPLPVLQEIAALELLVLHPSDPESNGTPLEWGEAIQLCAKIRESLGPEPSGRHRDIAEQLMTVEAQVANSWFQSDDGGGVPLEIAEKLSQWHRELLGPLEW
jgi:hypothetical protein